MSTYRLTIEYDGTRYRGWQIQQAGVLPESRGVHRPGSAARRNKESGTYGEVRTIQGEILHAANELLGGGVDLQGSGRTDAGVHALAQTAHLTTKEHASCLELQYGLNDAIPFDINVVKVETAPKNFHARRDCIGRSYLYQISKRRTAFGKRFVWWIKDPLDAVTMKKALSLFEGMHDFSSYCDPGGERTSPKVLVEEISLREFPEMIVIRIRASHFLWKLVRRLVGSAVEAGRHTVSIERLNEYLHTPSRLPAQWTAPPSGLFLEQARYKGEPWRDRLEPIVPIPNIK